RISLGPPIANTQLYVLDQRQRLVPVGVVGELYIGGDGVARGYLNRPALTAERFIPDPFSDQPGSRLYRTGDLVRYRYDGTLEFHGRADHQIKLRGFRIELGEIETALRQHPAIREAIVVARADNGSEPRLVAYIEPRTQNLEPNGEQANKETKEQNSTKTPSPVATGEGGQGGEGLLPDLRAFLRQRLPEYMLPSAWVFLDALPLTANGKLDRKALPVPERSQAQSTELIAPRTPTEATLAEIWRELLGIAQVGVHDNFFDHGGHSLLGAQLVSRVRKMFSVELPLSSFIEQPNIASLAAIIDQQQSQPAPRAPDKIQSIPRRGRNIGRITAQIDQLSESEAKQLLEEKRLAKKRDSHE
ncbi:MAG: non-ribosomal peptide synthetase, partial [Chloroflexi bacterium]|nr:non-ribosomal peptide synthetase [Chloroflexota bacterium]